MGELADGVRSGTVADRRVLRAVRSVWPGLVASVDIALANAAVPAAMALSRRNRLTAQLWRCHILRCSQMLELCGNVAIITTFLNSVAVQQLHILAMVNNLSK